MPDSRGSGRNWLAALGVGLGLTAALIAAQRRHASRAPVPGPPHPAASGPPVRADLPRPVLPTGAPAPREHDVATSPRPSTSPHAGAEVDGALRADARGHLVIDGDLRWFFDHYLSAAGELSDEELRARLRAEIQRQLPEPARTQAQALLTRYLSYLDAVPEVVAGESDPAARFRAVMALRRELLPAPQAEALFGAEERVIAAHLRHRDDIQETAPDTVARRLAVAELELELPPAARDALRRSQAPARALRREQALRQAGASVEAIAAERAATFGPAAARRLAELDAARTAWAARLAAYRRERERLRRSVPAGSFAARLEALRAARFSPVERLRVEALDRIEAGADP
jgi:lipase chaperone LimK